MSRMTGFRAVAAASTACNKITVIAEIPMLTHLTRQRLQFTLRFEKADDVSALIQMVPLAWKFSAEQKQQFAATLPDISVDFLLDVYQKA